MYKRGRDGEGGINDENEKGREERCESESEKDEGKSECGDQKK